MAAVTHREHQLVDFGADSSTSRRPRVAIAHDYLTQRGGAERVVIRLAEAFPDAPIITSVYEPDTTFPEFAALNVHTIPWMQRIPALRRDHRIGLAFYAAAFSRLHIDADVTICSSSGWAHGAHCSGRKVVYCHNPARWVWQPDDYLRELPRSVRTVARLATPALRRWDMRAAATADRYVSNSRVVAERVRRAYGVGAEVIHPPHGVDVDGPVCPIPGIEPGFFLMVARLQPYKNVDVALRAIAGMPEHRLLVIGRGPDGERLAAMRPDNAVILDHADEAQLRWAYRSCAALVGLAHEDFGLTPIEAAAFGRPTVALRWGGYLDTVVGGVTGLLVDHTEQQLVRDAMGRAATTSWDEGAITAHAERFAMDRFTDDIRTVVSHELSEVIALPH
jgi:glycosyltransferase involved in cell wall biosynthesis